MNAWKYGALSMIPFVIGIAIVAPFKDVLYGGDDWAYAWSVQKLLESGTLLASDWVTAQAVPQVLWASLLGEIFGWSLSILNISTIVAALFAGFAFFYIVVALGFKYKIALLATVVVTVSPLYLGMAGSFMSDSMYTSLLLISSACYIRAILNRSIIFAILGGLFCGAAILNRQFGIVLLIAYALALVCWVVISSTPQRREDILKIALPGIVLPIGMFVLASINPDIVGGKTIAQGVVIDTVESVKRLFDIPKILIKSLVMYDFLIVLLVPVIIPFLLSAHTEVRSLKENQWLLVLIGVALAGGLLVWYIRTGVMVQGDIFQVNAKYGNNEIWNGRIWMGLLFICIIPGTLMIARIFRHVLQLFNAASIANLVKRVDADSSAIAVLLIILCTVGHIVLTASHMSFYNNYFLPILPLLAICMLFVLRDAKQSMPLSVGLTLILFSSSVLDLESHARYIEASWKESEILVRSGESATAIFSSPSWYGWQNSDEVHDFMRRAVDDEMTSPINVFGHAYSNARIYIVGSTMHPLYAESDPRTVSYSTLMGRRELWVLGEEFE
ncbi:hypothetical protein N9J15_03425 [Porticoccaceae bacterium]|nr:hypothetical protein [Porticoccaceae bacterium]